MKRVLVRSDRQITLLISILLSTAFRLAQGSNAMSLVIVFLGLYPSLFMEYLGYMQLLFYFIQSVGILFLSIIVLLMVAIVSALLKLYRSIRWAGS